MLYSMDRGVKVGWVLTQSLEEPVQAENPCSSTSSSASVSWNFESQWACSAKSAAQVVRLDGLVCLLDYKGSETLEGNTGGDGSVAVQLSEASMDAARGARSPQGWQRVMTAPGP